MKIRHLVLGLSLMIASLTQVQAQLAWDKVEAGSFSSLALRSDGTIWSWGYNDNGQLGLGNNNQYESPVQIGSSTDWTEIAMGAFHCLALKVDGSLWAWGLNGNGQVGVGSNQFEFDAPVQVGNDKNWVKISAGQAHSMALKDDGSLWCWGLNSSMQLGTGDSQDKKSPVRIGNDNDWEVISAGGGHSHAIKSNGEMWAWGNNGNGQLGNGNNVNTSSPVKVGNDNDWWQVDGGFLFTVALKTDSSLFAWGDNNVGQVGNGIPGNKNAPVNIGNGLKYRSISAGSAFSFAIEGKGDLYGWGLNQFGQLGLGNKTNQSTPVKIGEDWSYIVAAEGSINNNSVDGFHSLGLPVNHDQICAAGHNVSGQLGIGNEVDKSSYECNIGLITGIQEADEQYGFKLFPNPTNGMFIIETPNHLRTIQIINASGQVVYTEIPVNIDGRYRNDFLNSQPSGLYLIQISTMNGVTSRRIVKN